MNDNQKNAPKTEILIVDDNQENLRLLTKTLSAEGYTVRSARNGSMALASAQVDPPDLILLDVVMPGLDGYEVCTRLKADERTRDIPVIFVSVKDEPLDIVKGFSVGGVDYIPKPITAEVLARVETHLALQRLRKQLEAQNIHLQKEIAERKKAEDKIKKHAALLEEAIEDLEAFSYSVSHDLRAPLRAIDGFSHILAEEYTEKLDVEGRRILNTIIDNTRKMAQLIEDLLSFARLGKQEIRQTDIDMEVQVKKVYNELKPMSVDLEIEFKTTNLQKTRGDISMIHQVIANLLSNAIKFSSPKKKLIIEVSCQVENNENIYCVKDNGVGFNMKYKDKLFGAFKRLHSSDEFEGTGVGLALVQRIIHRHGGRVWAESKVNKGATFYFSLPKKRRT